jgi:hypothetical protein
VKKKLKTSKAQLADTKLAAGTVAVANFLFSIFSKYLEKNNGFLF